MSKRLKVLLIVLGSVIVLAGIVFFVWRSTASAIGIGDIGGIVGGITKNSTEIRGTITAAGTNTKLSGVKVNASMGENMYTEVTSLTDGTYKVTNLRQGTEYTLTFNKDGYMPQSVAVKTNSSPGGLVKVKGIEKNIVLTLPLNVTLTNNTKGTNSVVLGTPVVLTWKVTNSNGTTVCTSRQSWKEAIKSSSGGSESITETQPGTYDYVLSCKNPEDMIGSPAQNTIIVTPKMGTPVSSTATMTGKVMYPGTKQYTAVGGKVTFVYSSGGKQVKTSSNISGGIYSVNLPTGQYVTSVYLYKGTSLVKATTMSVSLPTLKSVNLYF